MLPFELFNISIHTCNMYEELYFISKYFHTTLLVNNSYFTLVNIFYASL